ncbi:septum formation family protein [Herbiconiux sp. SYSU D00978]|uniref:septum formation family protein n=1 Tax=Herbiconiux sp. SYSU D00978 TaxID=2812562 RepID=UPI001A977936|nr:septum formation family protein [Herbiconiux sp. SYSU D00978]
MRGRTTTIAAILASGAMLTGCSGNAPALERDGSGQIVEVQSGIDVFELQPGDCFSTDDGGSGEVTSVKAIPCAEPHRFEVYHEFELPDGDFPADVDQQALTGCDAQFQAFVGVPNNQSKYEISYFAPTSASWAADDRLVSCLLFDPTGAEMTGSLSQVGQ